MKVSRSENSNRGDLEISDPPAKAKKTHRKRECLALNDEQEKELLKISYSSNFKHGLMIEVALGSGLRVNELVNLIIADLVLENKPAIRISDRGVGKYHNSFNAKTDLSNRTIPITNELADKLRAFIGNRKTGYVFQSQIKKERDFDVITKGSAIKFLNKYARKAESIHRTIGFHATRRTYASKLLDRGVPINQICLALGHSSIDTTIKYLRQTRKINADMIRKALEGDNHE